MNPETFDRIMQMTIAFGTVLVAMLWFFWQRYQSLERRFKDLEGELAMGNRERVEIRHQLMMFRQAEQSNVDRLQLFCNGNKELIEHRTRRFTDQLARIEAQLKEDLAEVKGYLARTTDFKIRDR